VDVHEPPEDVVIAVGLDLSLTCSGVSVATERTVQSWRVQTGPASDVLGTWRRIRTAASRVIRNVPAPCLVVVEWASYQSRNGQPDERAAQRWQVVGHLAELGCEVVKVAPSQRAKYATGNGRAKKPEVLASMRARHPLLEIPDHNVADSVALAAMGMRFLGAPIDGVASREQDEVMRAVRWPDIEGKKR
jgi:Holliday junction resolvasome RuvABC endonuclease subunit